MLLILLWVLFQRPTRIAICSTIASPHKREQIGPSVAVLARATPSARATAKVTNTMAVKLAPYRARGCRTAFRNRRCFRFMFGGEAPVFRHPRASANLCSDEPDVNCSYFRQWHFSPLAVSSMAGVVRRVSSLRCREMVRFLGCCGRCLHAPATPALDPN
jgi:hypothetical protein